MEKYGIELILDMHECDPETFTRESIRTYFEKLCVLIDMQREDLHFWDDIGLPPLKPEPPWHAQAAICPGACAGREGYNTMARSSQHSVGA